MSTPSEFLKGMVDELAAQSAASFSASLKRHADALAIARAARKEKADAARKVKAERKAQKRT